MVTPPSVPRIFDPWLVRQRLARAHAQGFEPFLIDRIADDAMDRLSAVTRGFVRVLDLGTPQTSFAARWQSAHPGAMVTRAGGIAQAGYSVICDEQSLPFADDAFDAVVSLIALQQVNDLPGTLAQVRRSLKPDGLFLACLLGGESLTELRQSFAAAEVELRGGISPRVAPFGDPRALGQLLQRAGFALPVADHDAITVRYSNVFALMRDLRRMGLANALHERSRQFLPRALLMRMAEIYTRDFSDADGKIRATFDCVWLSGWAPHESQQKPLAPGSAKMRLADVLQTREHGFDESSNSEQ